MCSCTHATAQVITMLYTHARQVLKWNNHVSDSMTMSLVCCSVESGVRSSFVCTLCGRGGPRQLARMLHVRRTPISARRARRPNPTTAVPFSRWAVHGHRAHPSALFRISGRLPGRAFPARQGPRGYTQGPLLRPTPPHARVCEARAERLHAGAASPPYAPSRSSIHSTACLIPSTTTAAPLVSSPCL